MTNLRIITSALAFAFAAQVVPHIYAAQDANNSASSNADNNNASHAVFVKTNSVTRNQIVAYSRADDGSLIERNRYDTGGRGSGGIIDPLGSQGSLILSDDHSLLFATNTSTGSISVFRVRGASLRLAQVISSGGSTPVAIAQYRNLVYVINAGGNSNVVGFRLDSDADKLISIPQSIRYLSATNTGASSLAFSPDGRFLVVTEKVTGNIDVFSVQDSGTLSQPRLNPDPISGLFDVVFTPAGAAVIVQTGSTPQAPVSSLSTYQIGEGGTLAPVTENVPTLGAAACWIVFTPNGQYAYIANSLSSTIAGFAIGGSGSVTPLPGTIVSSLPTGSINLDLAVSQDGKYIYTLNSGSGSVGTFAVQPDGGLRLVSLTPGLGAREGVEGLAAF